MILSDRDIKIRIDKGDLVIRPFNPQNLQPASIDVVLDERILVFDHPQTTFIDPSDPTTTNITNPRVLKNKEPFILHPGEFILGNTLEHIEIPDDLVARIEGKSTLGRLGLLIHSTAGYVDPGWRGTLTLELSNIARLPIALKPGMLIGQISFMKLSSPAQRPYGTAGLGSHYQDQSGPTASAGLDEEPPEPERYQ